MPLLTQESLAAWDLRDHLEYLMDRDTNIAMRFVDAVEIAYQKIKDHPETGFLWGFESESLQSVRAYLVPGFPNHVIFFRKNADEVRVLRVLHASRDVTREFRV